ncbi:MAG TPA: thermonuclease family protein [Streptosporangiaceae bacterium]|nr:thermonuclease family protein [Streptosporangiaceae bacterium]
MAIAVAGCPPAPGRVPSGGTVPVAPAPASPHPRRAGPVTRATVAYVIDGDTIIVTMRARRVRVRLLGIDAPEDTGRRGCFGARATAALRRLLPTGADVRVAVERHRADPYGRALGYVWRSDGLFVNRVLLRRGYATTLFLPPAGSYRVEFAAAEARARTLRAGLWRSCRHPPRPPPPTRRQRTAGAGPRAPVRANVRPAVDQETGQIRRARFAAHPPKPALRNS